jgi:DNA-binding CsgD family transcriptional regulator
VGRGEQLALLHTEAAQALSGEPRLVLVCGEAGIGKTRLVSRFLRELTGVRVLRSFGDEAEAETPYAVVNQLVRGQPLPSEEPITAGSGDKLATFPEVGSRLLGLLGDLQGSEPVVLVVDDAQWADPLSVQTVLFAVRRLRADRVLVLLTQRAERDDHVLAGVDRLIGAGRGARLDLTGLTLAEMGELVRSSTGHALSVLQLRRLWEHTHGNPLWATALMQELPADRLAASGKELPPPAALALSVRQRLHDCAPQTRDLVTAAAVLGARASLGRVSRLAGVTDPFGALDEAVRADLLERHGSPPAIDVSFPHPLIAAAVYDAFETAPRALLHRRAAALEADEAGRIRHEVAASTGQDRALSARVADYAQRQRVRGAVAFAASAYVTAAQLSPERHTHDELVMDAAETYLMAGEVGAAVALLADHPDLLPGRRLDYVRGWEAFASGRLDEARTLLARAWNHADDNLGGSAAGVRSYLELLSGHGLDAAAWAERAARSATEAWHRNISTGLAAMGSFVAGQPAKAEEALAWLPRGSDFPPDALNAAAVRANLRLFEGDTDQARADYLAILAASRSSGDFLLVTNTLGNLAEIAYRTGNWDEAVDYGSRAASVAADLDQTFVLACVHAVASPVHSRRGQWELAEHHVRAALEAARLLQDAASVAYAATSAAILAHSRRDFAGVLAAVEPMVQASTRDGIDEPGIFGWRDLQVEALVRLGRLDDAEAALAPFEQRSAERNRRSAMGCAARARGLLEAARHDSRAANAAFEAATAHLSAARMPFEEALAHLGAGAVQRRSGSRRSAARHLRAADEAFGILGAEPFLRWCEQELRGCGLTPARRSPTPLSLTPQEMSVARLVASGKTNREVAAELMLSPKTVEYHLGNVYSKLGVHSRTQLVLRLPAMSS